MGNALLDFAVQVGVIVALLWIMIAISPAKGVARWLSGIYRRVGRLIQRWTIAALRVLVVRLHYLISDGARRIGAWINDQRQPND